MIRRARRCLGPASFGPGKSQSHKMGSDARSMVSNAERRNPLVLQLPFHGLEFRVDGWMIVAGSRLRRWGTHRPAPDECIHRLVANRRPDRARGSKGSSLRRYLICLVDRAAVHGLKWLRAAPAPSVITFFDGAPPAWRANHRLPNPGTELLPPAAAAGRLRGRERSQTPLPPLPRFCLSIAPACPVASAPALHAASDPGSGRDACRSPSQRHGCETGPFGAKLQMMSGWC